MPNWIDEDGHDRSNDFPDPPHDPELDREVTEGEVAEFLGALAKGDGHDKETEELRTEIRALRASVMKLTSAMVTLSTEYADALREREQLKQTLLEAREHLEPVRVLIDNQPLAIQAQGGFAPAKRGMRDALNVLARLAILGTVLFVLPGCYQAHAYGQGDAGTADDAATECTAEHACELQAGAWDCYELGMRCGVPMGCYATEAGSYCRRTCRLDAHPECEQCVPSGFTMDGVPYGYCAGGDP